MRRGVLRATAGDQVRFTVRLWIDTENETHADNLLAVALHLASLRNSPKSAAEAITQGLEHLNAVEVVDHDGNGSVIYPDWP